MPPVAPFRRYELTVLALAAIVFLGCIVSPPSLMDDVDAAQPQIARNMLDSGDWVTARLDGVPYLEKPPLKYWLIAGSMQIFGPRDWAARLPIALSAIALCWLVFRMGCWAFSDRAGLYAGMVLSTCVGLFLFTRVLISDVLLTLTITLAMWSFLRALDDAEPRPRLWAAIMAAGIALGLLTKGLIAGLFPIAAALIYLAISRQLWQLTTWRKLHLFSGVLIVLAIAAPWHVLATLRNPPYFYFGLQSLPGQYHGFFWFYFFNEHLLRFLNLRYPHDYNTVPVLYFWLYHLLWLFPWSAYLPAVASLSFRPSLSSGVEARAGQMRLLALCWTGFILVFFSFSSTQEYYSMPCYPALALLLGSAMTSTKAKTIRIGTRMVSALGASLVITLGYILSQVWSLPAPGDIASALRQNPDAYTLSLGHMSDLTFNSFAYLRTPLIVALAAFLIGVSARWWRHPFAALALMMVVFFHAARLAMVTFDPYLSSRPLAEALLQSPPGQLIEDDAYYTFSSVFFYANRTALLLNGRKTNLEYGSYAPGAPNVFIDDDEFLRRWSQPDRYYLLIEKPSLSRLTTLLDLKCFIVVADRGGKLLLTNHAVAH